MWLSCLTIRIWYHFGHSQASHLPFSFCLKSHCSVIDPCLVDANLTQWIWRALGLSDGVSHLYLGS